MCLDGLQTRKLGQSPLNVTATQRWKSMAGISSLVTLTYHETVHNTQQPFGKLKQTLSKKLQETVLANLAVESAINGLTHG